MKKSLLTLGIALFGFTAVFAQDNSNMATEDNAAIEAPAQDQTARESISADKLPSAVRAAVQTGKYEAMEIKEAYKVAATQTGQTGGNMAASAYEVTLVSEDGQTTTVTLNEQGQIVKSDDSEVEDTDTDTSTDY